MGTMPKELYVFQYIHKQWVPHVSQGPKYLHTSSFFRGPGKAMLVPKKKNKIRISVSEKINKTGTDGPNKKFILSF